MHPQLINMDLQKNMVIWLSFFVPLDKYIVIFLI
jgi:hypothetical protein